MKRAFESIAIAVLITTMLYVKAFAGGEVTTLDDGDLYLFVSNNGTFAFDSSASRGEYSGLYYPKNTYRWVMSGGGIWVAGKKGDQWRVTISGDESEFVSGPAYGRTPAASPFPIYKITRGENYVLNDDYRNWPATLGAPIDAVGQPIIMGSQCLYTLFNDTDSAAHGFDIAGTLPLGVEVKLYAYTYDNTYQTYDTMMTQVVFLEYTITNRSSEMIDSCIITIYGDPDIGYSNDDRVGSDVETGMAYCYSEGSHDQYYGDKTPAVGICLLNDRASSSNFYYFYRRNDPPSVRLDSLYKTINLVKGLQLMGEPYIDSSTMLPTKFPFSGNPVDSTGWINALSEDYRFVINASPISLQAGDSIKVVAALIVARGETNKESVRKLLATTRSVRELYRQNVAATQLRASSADAVTIRGANIRGKDWGGRFLTGGLDFASRYFGDTTEADLLPTMRVNFSSSPVQKAYRYIPEGSSFKFAGFAKECVEVVDTDSGERLEYCYIDADQDGTISNADGKLDPLVVFTTPYSDTPRPSHTDSNLRAPSQDKLLAIELDASLADLFGGGLIVDTKAVSSPFALRQLDGSDTLFVAEPVGSAYSERTLVFSNDTRFLQEIDLVSSDPAHLRIIPARCELGTGESTFVFLHCYPPESYDFSGTLNIFARRLRSDYISIPVALDLGSGVSGDANEDGVLTLNDLIEMIRILYRGAPMLTPQRLIDSNCDGVFGLADLVIFINALYQQTDLPCQMSKPR
jgi:hypothetical protein